MLREYLLEKWMALEQLVYVSTAVREFGDAELGPILDASVRHNRQNGVTGILLYARGCFLQVLEGEAAALDEVMARIMDDTRHRDVFILDRTAIAQRDFGEWYMSFHRPSEAALASAAFLPLFSGLPDLAVKFGGSPGIVGVIKGFVADSL